MKPLSFHDLLRHQIGPYCMAEIVFNTVMNPAFDYPAEELTQQLNAMRQAWPTPGFYMMTNIDQVSQLSAVENAVVDLATAIQRDHEIAEACYCMLDIIAGSGFWSEEDFTYDCMVAIGLKPEYALYLPPSLECWSY